MSIELNGTSGIQFNDGSDQSTAATPYGRKNLIINGDMRIAQRGTSTTGITGNGYYTVDRFDVSIGTGGTWTQTQDTDVPSGQGFTSSLKMDCTTANASLGASSLVVMHQAIEAQNLQHLKFGTSSAESLTLSFWVKSNKTGTYTAEFYLQDDARQNSQTFTIDTADTWEKKTITIDGDTVGVIDNDNGAGLTLFIWLASGSTWTSGTLNTSWNTAVNANRVSSSQVNLADSTSNYINITGVQLEVGDAASDFEFMPYDMELARCQRYYYKRAYSFGCSYASAFYYSTTYVTGIIEFPTEMRAKPTLDHTTGTNYYRFTRTGGNDSLNSFTLSSGSTSSSIAYIYNNTEASGTAGYAGVLNDNGIATTKLAFNAEL